MFDWINNILDNYLMKSEIKALARTLKYLFTFMATYFIATPVHEWMHLTVAMLLGGEGVITRKATIVGLINVTEYTVMPTVPTPEIADFLVSLSGGTIVGTLFLVMALIDWSDGDKIGAMAMLPLGFAQLFYGVAEGLCYNMTIWQFSDYGAFATIVGLLIGFGYSLWTVGNYIIKDLWTEKKL